MAWWYSHWWDLFGGQLWYYMETIFPYWHAGMSNLCHPWFVETYREMELLYHNFVNEKENILDCFTPLLARHLADVSCFIGPSMPSWICMEIDTKIMQKRKKKQSHDEGIPRQSHAYSYIDQSHTRLGQPITKLDRNILRGHQPTK